MTSRLLVRAAALLACALAPSLLAWSAGADTGRVPAEVRRQLERAVQARVDTLVKEKDAHERSFRRASFSRDFRPQPDGTYLVALLRETIDGDVVRSERMTLTLRPSSDGRAFEVAAEKIDGSIDALVRTMPGDETHFAFDAFAFEREGLVLRAGKGTIALDTLRGRPITIVLAADGLSYSYEPPRDWSYAHLLHQIVTKEQPKDFAFEPGLVRFDCDPESCAAILDLFVGRRPIDAAAARPAVTKYLAEKARDRSDREDDNPFAAFWLPHEKNRRWWTVSVRRGTSDHWTWLTCDEKDPLEVAFGASTYGRLHRYPSAATRATRPVIADIERRVDDDTRDVDIEGISGTVELGLESPEDLAADLTFTLTARRDLDRLPFWVARMRSQSDTKDQRNPNLVINSIDDGDGNELHWTRTGPTSGVVLFDAPRPAGSTLVVRIQFLARRSILTYSTSFAYLSREGWLPFVRIGDMIPFFDLTVKVPEKYKVLGICTRAESRVENGVSITRWTSRSPVVFPTVIYGIYEEASAAVEAKRTDGTKIPVTIHVDTTGMSDWDIRPKQLAPLADQAALALNFYRDVYGVDYPFAKLDLVNDPLGTFYGQAPSSIVYLGSGVFRGEGMIGTYAGSGLTKFTKAVVPHEVAHQWWGSLVSNANDRNYWFIESLAEFSAALFVEASFGPKAYLQHVDAWRREVLDTDLMSSIADANQQWSGTGGGYTAALYNKGPYAFHVLRTTFGDEKMKEFLRALAREFAGKEIVTSDIERVANDVYGGSMGWFFDQWIRGLGLPEFTLDWTRRQTEDGKWLVEGTVSQRVVAGLKKHPLEGVYFRGKVPLTVSFGGERVSRVPVIVEGASTPFRFKVAEKPTDLALNAQHEVLAPDVVVRSRP